MKKNIIQFKSIIKKEVNRFIRIWIQTFIPFIIHIFLYITVFGKVLSKNISYINNISYIEYIIPGLIMISMINSSFSNVSFSIFNDRYYGSIEEMLISPMNINLIIIGYISGGIIRGLFTSTLSFIIIHFLYKISINNILGLFTISIISILIFSLFGMVVGLLSRKIDDVNLVSIFITPLIYLGGAFHSINMLSNFWKNISKFNPIFYIINEFRYNYIGIKIGNYNSIYIYILLIILVIILYIKSYLILKYKENIKL